MIGVLYIFIENREMKELAFLTYSFRNNIQYIIDNQTNDGDHT